MPVRDAVAVLAGYLRADHACGMKQGHKGIYIARAPGRLDVLGGAAEFSGGTACAWALEAGAAVAVQRREDRKLFIVRYGADGGREAVEISLDDFYGSAALMPAAALQRMFAGERHWAAHVAGAFPALARHKKITRKTAGANIACFCDIPDCCQKGESPRQGESLGTAAAMACATLFGLAAAHHLILEPLEIAILAHRLEAETAGEAGGYAEPMTAVFGKKESLLAMKGQPHELIGYCEPPRGCVFAGLHAAGTGHEDAAKRVRISATMAQAIIARIYRDLGVKKDPTAGYLANVPLGLWERYFRKIVPEEMTGEDFLRESEAVNRSVHGTAGEKYFPLAAAEFLVREQERAQQFIEPLRSAEAGAGGSQAGRATQQAPAAGRLMLDSLAGQADLARRFAAPAAAEEADLWRELVMASDRGPEKGFYGVRGVGTWPNGTVAILMADTDAARAQLTLIAAEFQARTGRPAQILMGSSSGAAETAAMRLETSEIQ